MKIEVYCDNPVRMTEYLSNIIEKMGTEPYRMRVQSISRKGNPYHFSGVIEHVRGKDADHYLENLKIQEARKNE